MERICAPIRDRGLHSMNAGVLCGIPAELWLALSAPGTALSLAVAVAETHYMMDTVDKLTTDRPRGATHAPDPNVRWLLERRFPDQWGRGKPRGPDLAALRRSQEALQEHCDGGTWVWPTGDAPASEPSPAAESAPAPARAPHPKPTYTSTPPADHRQNPIHMNRLVTHAAAG